jgi:tRNA-2-methylthio-N6-dimethylallyladenosine synthase
VTGKAFYIETFGCQMNAHDSEKVVGTLLAKGYNQVETPDAADLVLYNTCSIRDKAEQKVFNRLQNFKRAAGKGKVFGVLGCVAQQEGEKIFERAPHVSLVAGSASYTQAARDAGATRGWQPPRDGLSLDTDETFDTPFTRRDNPHRAYITIIEGCDKSCAYCVVPFTRGPERSRTSESVMAEARRLAESGYTEIQLLGQNVNSYRDPSPAGWDFATLLARAARDFRHSARALHDFASARFHQGDCGRHGRQSGAVQSRASAGAVRFQPDARGHAAALYARRIHAAHRMDQGTRGATWR